MKSAGQIIMEKPAWAQMLSLKGDCYEGFVEDLQSVMCMHSSSTLTTYGVRRSHSNSKPSASPTKEASILAR